MPVFVIADHIFSPLGNGSTENFNQLLAGKSGIQLHDKKNIHPQPFYASLFGQLPLTNGFTRFEQMLANAIDGALANGDIDPTAASTGLIISTTKGNIGLLEEGQATPEDVSLFTSAQKMAAHIGNPNKPVVVSNACISGLSALITGMRMIEAGIYQDVLVAGADAISAFVFSGFNAFQAISPQPCRPYDANRSGVTLGEAAACIILSAHKRPGSVELRSGAGSNDANHISGPSRTGVELATAMKKAIEMAGLSPADIDLVSAHGTATIYNDEMESKAINLSNLQQVPVNSLKGYYGHTLGAAGIIESVIAIQSIKNETIIPTMGYENPGVSQIINVASQLVHQKIQHCLKTASGFGGCNAAVVFSR